MWIESTGFSKLKASQSLYEKKIVNEVDLFNLQS